jgi:hypothetical protein
MSFNNALAAATLMSSSMAFAQLAPPPPPPPNPMVWQQGINQTANWQRLGCPKDYANDLEKEHMIKSGQCRNVNADGTAKTDPRSVPVQKRKRRR